MSEKLQSNGIRDPRIWDRVWPSKLGPLPVIQFIEISNDLSSQTNLLNDSVMSATNQWLFKALISWWTRTGWCLYLHNSDWSPGINVRPTRGVIVDQSLSLITQNWDSDRTRDKTKRYSASCGQFLIDNLTPRTLLCMDLVNPVKIFLQIIVVNTENTFRQCWSSSSSFLLVSRSSMALRLPQQPSLLRCEDFNYSFQKIISLIK